MTSSIMPTYSRLPVTFARGEGAWLWDTEGNRYLDALAGIAVCGLGHAHPAVKGAIADQAGTLIHTSNLYGITSQQILADRLTQASGLETAFFCNSGAEANEAAIKLARRYGHYRDVATPTIIVMENSFHGRTLATLTATGNRKVHAGFEPLVQGFARAPYNDLETVARIGQDNSSVVAILVEPVQGEGGVRIPDPGYLSGLRKLADEHGWLLMFDEVQTGMGRTGRMFGFQHSDIRPDVMTLAKALGNGVPIGACLAGGKAADVLKAGEHGSTFGGNPLSCSAALAVMDTLEHEHLAERADTLGASMQVQFREQLGDVEGVVDIRGQGLMLGIELDRPCGELVREALANGLLINVTADSVIRLLPPLIITHEQADQIVTTVSRLVSDFLGVGAQPAKAAS